MSTIPRSGALALAALVAACGGGGGGGGDDGTTVVVPSGPRSVSASAGADVSSTNFGTLSPPMVRAVLGGSANGLISPLQADDRSRALATGPGPAWPGGTMLAWLRHLPDPSRKRAAAVSSEVLPCELSGSITVRFDDADNNGTPSRGDSLQFTAVDCVDGFGLPAANGGFTMNLNAVELQQGEPVALDVSGTFQNFALQGYGSLNGAFRLWTRFETAASTRLRVSYQGTVLADPSGTVVYDFDIDGLANEISASYEISGGIGVGGATYAVSTGVRLQVAAGQFPAVGQVSFRDAAGDSVRVVARSATSFDLEFYAAGATSPGGTMTALRWSDYTGTGD